MNADLAQATREIGVGNKDIAEVAHAKKKSRWIALPLLGVLTAVVSFMVGFEFPFRNEPEPYAYPLRRLVQSRSSLRLAGICLG